MLGVILVILTRASRILILTGALLMNAYIIRGLDKIPASP